MFSVGTASVMLMAGTALAGSLTTITPCVGCPSSVSQPPITVSSQYQTVSTCAPTSACARGGLCQTSYPYETFAYVSTVIPCAGGSATITKTDQPVTVSRYRTTVTSFSTPAGRRHAKPTPVYSTIGQDYVLPYNRVGPLAIPGYGGSGLCTDCGEDASGARRQPVAVTECTAGPAGTRCVEYTKTLVSTSAPSAVSKTAAACSTNFNAPSAGTYTFTFPHSAPARTITANGHTFTVGGQNFNVYASRFIGHPGPFQFQTTVTATITQTVPASTIPARATHSAPVPPFWNHRPSSAPSDPSWPQQTTSSSSADSSTWLDWTSSTSSPSTPGTWSTTSSNPWGSSSTSATMPPAWSSTATTTPDGDPTTTTTTPYGYPTTTTTTTWTTTTTTTTTTSTTTSSTTSVAITPAPSLSDIPPSVTPLYISVNVANARYRKRAVDYVSFGSGGDAVLVSDISAASQFKLYEGYMIDLANGEYVGTDATSGTPALEEFTDAASASNNWGSSGGSISFGDVSFCYNSDNELFMVFPGASNPAGCVNCVLDSAPVTTTTSTTTTSTTTSTAPTNSSTLEEREMESQEKEYEQPEVVDKRAVKRRHGLLHKH